MDTGCQWTVYTPQRIRPERLCILQLNEILKHQRERMCIEATEGYPAARTSHAMGDEINTTFWEIEWMEEQKANAGRSEKNEAGRSWRFCRISGLASPRCPSTDPRCRPWYVVFNDGATGTQMSGLYNDQVSKNAVITLSHPTYSTHALLGLAVTHPYVSSPASLKIFVSDPPPWKTLLDICGTNRL